MAVPLPLLRPRHFLFGGITGIINASYSMNNLVHNTAWIPAHFHLTVGGPIFLGNLGMSLFLITGILKNPSSRRRWPWLFHTSG